MELDTNMETGMNTHMNTNTNTDTDTNTDTNTNTNTDTNTDTSMNMGTKIDANLQTNIKQEFFNELDWHIQNDDEPSKYVNSLRFNKVLTGLLPFSYLGDLTITKQSPLHHPEGSVWNHTMLVLDQAAKRKVYSMDPRVFMWTALLHDIGKAVTTKVQKGRITAYDHDKAGEDLSIQFLSEFSDDHEFITKVSKMIRWHMQLLYVVQELPFSEIEKMRSEVCISEMALFMFCDRLGRAGMTLEKTKKEQRNVEIFTTKCKIEVENTNDKCVMQ